MKNDLIDENIENKKNKSLKSLENLPEEHIVITNNEDITKKYISENKIDESKDNANEFIDESFKNYTFKRLFIGKTFIGMLKFYIIIIVLYFKGNQICLEMIPHYFNIFASYSFLLIGSTTMIIISIYLLTIFFFSCLLKFKDEKDENNFKSLVCNDISYFLPIANFLIGSCFLLMHFGNSTIDNFKKNDSTFYEAGFNTYRNNPFFKFWIIPILMITSM